MIHEPTPPAAARPFLETLKRKGPATIRELSQRLRITYEAARQQMNALLDGGWVTQQHLITGHRPVAVDARSTMS